MEILAEPIPSK